MPDNDSELSVEVERALVHREGRGPWRELPFDPCRGVGAGMEIESADAGSSESFCECQNILFVFEAVVSAEPLFSVPRSTGSAGLTSAVLGMGIGVATGGTTALAGTGTGAARGTGSSSLTMLGEGDGRRLGWKMNSKLASGQSKRGLIVCQAYEGLSAKVSAG